MTDFPRIDELSDEELELLSSYLDQTGDFWRDSVAEILTQEVIDQSVGGRDAADILPFISDSLDPIDLQTFLLSRMETEILDGIDQFSRNTGEFPEGAEITPEKLNRIWVKKEITYYFNLLGTLIEQLSSDLIIEEVVDEKRESNSVRKKIKRMPQREREWLLYITGVIDEGEKGEIRRAYDFRNKIAHGEVTLSTLEGFSDIETNVQRSHNALDTLYEKAHDIPMDFAISNWLTDEDSR